MLIMAYPRKLQILLAIFFMGGCAVHYYDPATKAEHIYGLGHMVMKAQQNQENQIAVVNGESMLGFSLGTLREGPYLGAGWAAHRSIQVIDSNSDFLLIWPNADWFNFRIGNTPNEVLKQNSGR